MAGCHPVVSYVKKKERKLWKRKHPLTRAHKMMEFLSSIIYLIFVRTKSVKYDFFFTVKGNNSCLSSFVYLKCKSGVCKLQQLKFLLDIEELFCFLQTQRLRMTSCFKHGPFISQMILCQVRDSNIILIYDMETSAGWKWAASVFHSRIYRGWEVELIQRS